MFYSKLKRLVGIGLVCFATSGIVQAKTKLEQLAGAEFQDALSMIQSSGGEVVKSFDTSFGLKAHLVKVGAQHTMFYETPDGKHLVMGAVINGKGENLTQKYTEELAPKPDYSGMYESLEKNGMIIKEGRGTNKVFVFYEPNCGYCSRLFDLTRSYLDNNTIMWVPVAFLSAKSDSIVANIVESENPSEALAAYENGKRTKSAVAMSKNVSNAVSEGLQTNARLMQLAGLKGTPGIVYKNGGRVDIVRGVPSTSEAMKNIFR